MNQKIELNPFTNKPLNPEIQIEKNGKVHRVEYMEDHLKKTGVFDHRIGRGVWRLNGMLKPDEWRAVRRYFKDYGQKWFKWGTAEPDMVISILTKMRNPNVDIVTVRHKMTADGVKELQAQGGNIKDCITGEWLIPVDDD